MPIEDLNREQGAVRTGTHHNREDWRRSQDPRDQPEIQKPVDPRHQPEPELPIHQDRRYEDELPREPADPDIGPITPEPDRSPGQPSV